MSISIASAAPAPIAAPVSQNQTNAKPSPGATARNTGQKDTVHLSAPAQAAVSAAKAALQEATETQAQTAKEARSGDLQAAKLLSTEIAAEKQLPG
jgi:hypothetical protein